VAALTKEFDKVSNIIPVTISECTNGKGETVKCLSRPKIDGDLLWLIFLEQYNGNMDMYDMLTSLDKRVFSRRTPLSEWDIKKARNGFRAVEKHGRKIGQPCVPLNDGRYRGKTGIRLAALNNISDNSAILSMAKYRDKIQETHLEARDELASAVGVLGHELKLARQRDAENKAAADAHEERMSQPSDGWQHAFSAFEAG
jgi:hypothetical protein